MDKTGCGPRAAALYAAYHQRALELAAATRETGREWTPEEKAELDGLLKVYLAEVDAHFRREERKAKRLERGGTWSGEA